MIRSWLVCEAILRLAISVVAYWAYFFLDPNLIIDNDHLLNIPLFLFQTGVIFYTTVKTYYSFKRAKIGLYHYVKPCWLYAEIIFSIICIIGAVALANICRDSEIPTLQETSIWLAFLDVHFILNLLITAVTQREVHSHIARIKTLNEKSLETSQEDAILGYQLLYNERLFGQNLNMWRNESMKTTLEYEYYRLQYYLRTLNELSLADRSVFSAKLDQLRSDLNDHANKLTQQDKTLHKWKVLTERAEPLQVNNLYSYNESGSKIRDFCF